MAQVSYGTITITDTTDIEDVFLIYKGSSSNTVAPSITWSGTTNDWKTDITQVTGDYIWAITVFKRTGITITSSNYTDYYSDPVCLTGEPGTSITITSIKYSTATTQAQPANNTFTLNSPPTVPEGGWLWSRTLFSSGQSVYSKAKQGEDGVSPTVSKTGGTVTITDAEGHTVTVTDGANGQSYYTYIRYSVNSNGSGMVDTPTANTKYIGVYSGTSSDVPAYTDFNWSKYVGDNGTSVSISSIKYAKSTTDSQPADSSFGTTMPSVGEGEWLWTMTTYSNGSKVYTKSKQGATGPQGISVTAVRELYYLTTGGAPSKPTSSTTIYDYDVVGAWTSVVPEYIAGGNYYISLETTLSNSTKTWSNVVLDQALTDANYNAYLAQSLAQHANEDAYGAMSQVTATQYELEALDAKLKYFFYPGDSNYPGVYAASGISGTTFNEGSISTYGYNVSIKPASIGIGYNNIKAILIDGSNPSLKFYAPSKTEQAANPSMELTSSALIFNKIGTANKSVELTNSALNFYGSSTSTPDAQLSSTGLQISNGAIIIGSTSGTSAGSIALSNSDFTRSINGTSRSNLRLAIGQYFGVKNDGTLYASNAVISGTISVGSGSTIDAGATISGTSASTVVSNASTGAQAASDLSAFQTTVGNTYATQANSVYRTQRIYYRKTSSGAPNKNETWLTTSGTGYGNWSLNIPQLTNNNTKYPYLYTAVQTQTVTQYNNGSGTTCSCSNVLLDNTTTVIDGGSIIAGSVTANEITGSKLSAIYADMGNITAGNITKGYNSINFDSTPATLEFKNASTWASATQGIKYDSNGLAIKGSVTATSLTIASGATVSGVVVPSEIADMATTTNSNWTVNIVTTGTPNYITPSVTLKATVYHEGAVVTTGFTRAWYKNGTGSSLGSGETITVTDVDAFYTCVISSSS